MTALHKSAPAMLVPMQEETVARLLATRTDPEDSLDRVIMRLVQGLEGGGTARHHGNPQAISVEAGGKWSATVLGETLAAETLGRLFAEIIDLIHACDPMVVERLSRRRGRKRRFVSRTKEGVHGGRLDLELVRARSGWWVSGCVSARDVRRALEVLCGEAGLDFGRDIQFPNPGAGD